MRRSCLVFLLCVGAGAQTLDPQLKDRAFEHVVTLAALGNRIAGTANEAKAQQYVKEQFDKLGLKTVIEPFEIRSFALEKAVVKLGKTAAPVWHLDFDPYSGERTLTGEAVLVTPEMMKQPGDFAGKIAVASRPVNFFQVMYRHPKAVAGVAPEDFARLREEAPGPATIEVTGKEVKLRSANVVGTLAARQPGAREIILSAHLDSVEAPGAQDNASGVGVLIELARYYAVRENAFTMRFVALGAEEIGRLGAKAYLEGHLKELENCELLFNMDSIGGKEGIYVEMRDGVKGIRGKAQNQLPAEVMNLAETDQKFNWILLRPGPDVLQASDVPEWLQRAIEKTAEEQGVKIIQVRGMGSDHKVFHQAGIPATNIAISGIKSHSPEDVPGQIVVASLETAAKFVAGVVEKTPFAKPR